jgi:hypothetical protein
MVRRQEVFFLSIKAGGVALYTGESIICRNCNAVTKSSDPLHFFTPRFTSTRDATIRSSHQPPRSLPDVGSSPEHRLPLAGVIHKPLLLRRARARAQPCLPAAHRPPSTTSSHPACELVVDRVQAAPWSAPAGACQSE